MRPFRRRIPDKLGENRKTPRAGDLQFFFNGYANLANSKTVYHGF